MIIVVYSIQTVTCMTICAHTLGFSNSQSTMLASAVRIAHSLGIHRLPPARSKKGTVDADAEIPSDILQKEMGRRLWLQLASQDWFSVPFSETYCMFEYKPLRVA